MALTLVVELALAGCGGSKAASTPDGSRDVKITTPDGETLEATVVGSGTTGVVIAHGANATRANWFDAGNQIAAAGFMVVMPNLRGIKGSTGTAHTNQDVDVLAAATWLEGQGVDKIALIGSSMGATSVLVASTERPVIAVVALSPPQQSFAMDAAAATSKITAPVALYAAQGDKVFAESTTALAELLKIEPHLVSGNGHGTGMLADNPDVIPQIIDFLKQSATA